MDLSRVFGLSNQGCSELNLAISESIFKVSVCLVLLLLSFASLPMMVGMLVNDWRIDDGLVSLFLPMILKILWLVAMLYGALLSLLMAFIPVNGVTPKGEAAVQLLAVLCLGVASNVQVVGVIHSDASLMVSVLCSMGVVCVLHFMLATKKKYVRFCQDLDAD
jgi:hypothetical protein